MSEYQGYKIKRPHSLTPLTSVYEAVAVDGRPGRFALKIFHPPASTQAKRIYALEGWLLAAERQKQAAKKDGSVVEVLAYGRCEEGAFAVMPWQERFLEPWIKTLHQKGDTLRALATCLLNTIEAWEKETGGPHGNLKPSNIFLDHSGPLTGMTARLSDPAFMPGAKTEALRLADLNAVGNMLATIVRRRLPGAWPIEEAPEWKALGGAGKGWLDFCNYLLNPQPNEGEVTLANARLRLKKVPKDANPVKTAALTLAAVLVLGAIGVVGFARFGNFITMPDQIQPLAVALHNPTIPKDVPPDWTALCVAWDTWLVDMQGNADRLLRTEGLLDPDDPLRAALTNFSTDAKNLRPEALVPEAASEKRLGVLGSSPPEAVFNQLLLRSTVEKLGAAIKTINALNRELERWQRWDQLRNLQKLMSGKGFTQVADRLASRLPPARSSAEFGKQNVVRTLKFFNDISLDDTGTLPLASRWSEISHHQTDMLASGEQGDRIQMKMPEIILGRLEDKSSLSDFADSLVPPLEEMRKYRKEFTDPQVVRERFLKESELLKGTAEVVPEDFPKWELELVEFSKVPKAEDPRFEPDMETISGPPPATVVDLEEQAPEGEPENPLKTFSKSGFEKELVELQANLKTFQAPDIVNRDKADKRIKKKELTGVYEQLLKSLEYTLTLLKPEPWLAKAALPFGKYTETKNRWKAWQLEALTGVTADALRGATNRPRFRQLRADKGKLEDWIKGVEGDDGFGGLKEPDLTKASNDTAAELKRLEAVLRDRKVTDVVTAAAASWIKAVPVKKWAEEGANVRQPLEAHRTWLTELPDFASNLDELSKLLTNGFGLDEGVSAVAAKLKTRVGLSDLTGKPAEWYAESNQLVRLLPVSDRTGLLAAAQGGRLSQKLMVWRKLSSDLTDWPTGAADFDLDLGVVTVMRQIVGSDVKDEERKNALMDEMGKGTKLRFNRAARTAARTAANAAVSAAARAEKDFTGMFNLMQKAGLTEDDLDEPVHFNYALWQLKTADRNEKSLNVLGTRRDAFVAKVNGINGLKEQADVVDFVNKLSKLELKDDPSKNRSTTSPETLKIGWREELTDEGLGLKATWKSGDKSVVLEYSIVQPTDGTDPFYLARRAIAVGEFLDLMAGRPNEAKLVKAELPEWAKSETPNKPWNMPIAWRPRSDFSGLELNIISDSNPKATWIYKPNALVLGLVDDTELRAATPPLELAFKKEENPTALSPLQQISPAAAKVFVEKMLGARLPTIKEWQAVLKETGTTATNGHLRGPNFQNLWQFIEAYRGGGQIYTWRPNEGIFLPVDPTTKQKFKDDGQVNARAEDKHLWFRPVDEGTPTPSGKFINLTGNVSIFLTGDKPNKFYVAGGSVLSPPGIDFTQPQEITASTTLIGAKAGSEAYSDVGIRPAFDAPYGFKLRFKLIVLVRDQKYLTL